MDGEGCGLGDAPASVPPPGAVEAGGSALARHGPWLACWTLLAASSAVTVARHELPPLFDEATYLAGVRALADAVRDQGPAGLFAPFVRAGAALYPPLARIPAALAALASGDDPRAIRLVGLLPAALALWLAATLARARAGSLAGALAPVLLVAMPGFVGFSRVLKEDFFAASVAAGVAGWLALRPRPAGPIEAAALGGAVAAAALSKQSALVWVGVPLLVYTAASLAPGGRVRHAAATLAVAGALSGPWYALHSEVQGGLVAVNAGVRLADVPGHVHRALVRDLVGAPVLALGAAGLVLLLARGDRPGRRRLAAAILVPSAVVAGGFSWENSRYWLPLLPLLAASGAEAAAALAARANPGLVRPGAGGVLALAGASALAVVNLWPAAARDVPDEGAVHAVFQRTGLRLPLRHLDDLPGEAGSLMEGIAAQRGTVRVGLSHRTLATEALKVRWDEANRERLFVLADWSSEVGIAHPTTDSYDPARFASLAGRWDVMVYDTHVPVVKGRATGPGTAEIPVPGFPELARRWRPESRTHLVFLARESLLPGRTGQWSRILGRSRPPGTGEHRYALLFDSGQPPALGEGTRALPQAFVPVDDVGRFALGLLPEGDHRLAVATLDHPFRARTGPPPAMRDVQVHRAGAPFRLAAGSTLEVDVVPGRAPAPSGGPAPIGAAR